ncbi:MAG: 1-deoxy-D-xylulose-5-phosphate reductoisomerase [Rikenellaceae bacterium]
MKRKIAILGSTGSIGTQALDVISKHPDLFEVECLTANSNAELLIRQAKNFNVNSVVIADENRYNEVFEALDPFDIKVFAGIKSISSIVSGDNIDMVLIAMVGFSGFEPTIAAIKAGKAIALANKETLVAAGSIIMKLAKEYSATIIPVDSEHSAIFQCLQGEKATIEKILLTASGGPFFRKNQEEIASATVEQALSHPNWNMGAKVTIDSANMMNKGFEMIEARWLFNINPSEIEILIHPQSVVHSMVQFSDGSVSAQMSTPDMRLPILYALSYPFRVDLDTKRLNFAELRSLEFFKPDLHKFPCLSIAYEVIKKGGNFPCAMTAANEIAVKSFLSGEISFAVIPKIIKDVLSGTEFVADPSIDDIYKTDQQARELASNIKLNY